MYNFCFVSLPLGDVTYILVLVQTYTEDDDDDMIFLLFLKEILSGVSHNKCEQIYVWKSITNIKDFHTFCVCIRHTEGKSF